MVGELEGVELREEGGGACDTKHRAKPEVALTKNLSGQLYVILCLYMLRSGVGR